MNNEEAHERFLWWRNIDTEFGDIVCSVCGGSGVRSYGNTSTYMNGIGGQAMTMDVCDKCWGSGKENDPWVNLKKLNQIKDAIVE